MSEADKLATDRPAFIKDKKEKSIEAGGDDAAMATQLRKLKDEKEELETNLKACNASIDALSLKLAESMEAHGVDSFKVKGIGSVYLSIINRPRIIDADTFIKWLDETGQGAMAPRTVHWKRLESMVKELIESATALPTSLENFQQTRALIRRA